MTYFNSDNTEIFVPFLGLKESEFECLRKLIETYLSFYEHCKIPFFIIDQSKALHDEINGLERKNNNAVFKLHERYSKEMPSFENNPEKISAYFNELTRKYSFINVITLGERLFHSQCLNHVLNNLSTRKFNLIFDSDIELLNGQFWEAVAISFPETSWDTMLAVGEFADELLQDSGNVYKDSNSDCYRKMRFPRLYPHMLIVNNEVFKRYGVDFKLLFLNVIDACKENRNEIRVLGDCGSSLVFWAAYHGLSIGHIDANQWMVHNKSASFGNLDVKNVYKWW